jgi:hypothetical protein
LNALALAEIEAHGDRTRIERQVEAGAERDVRQREHANLIAGRPSESRP